MPKEYATKVVTAALNQNKGTLKIPLFQLQYITLCTDQNITRGYGLEVRAHDVSAILTSIKISITPGDFVPFQFKVVKNTAYKKSVEYIHSKNETT